MRCLHCHGGEALQEDSHSLARDRCYYCQHSKYGNGRMECEKCQVRGLEHFMSSSQPSRTVPASLPHLYSFALIRDVFLISNTIIILV